MPFKVRLVVRSAYVLLITLLACVMPFFGAFAGLVGAVTFFPLAIYFPYALYRKVFPVSPAFSALLWIVWCVTGAIACIATIGAVRNVSLKRSIHSQPCMHGGLSIALSSSNQNCVSESHIPWILLAQIIVGWSTYKIFGQ